MLARLDVGEELGVGDVDGGRGLVVSQVNSSAAVPTTSTSITMPFRKNLGFKRGASECAERQPRAVTSSEYSVGPAVHPLTEVTPAPVRTDDRA